jgi:hypothetical protein
MILDILEDESEPSITEITEIVQDRTGNYSPHLRRSAFRAVKGLEDRDLVALGNKEVETTNGYTTLAISVYLLVPPEDRPPPSGKVYPTLDEMFARAHAKVQAEAEREAE